MRRGRRRESETHLLRSSTRHSSSCLRSPLCATSYFNSTSSSAQSGFLAPTVIWRGRVWRPGSCRPAGGGKGGEGVGRTARLSDFSGVESLGQERGREPSAYPQSTVKGRWRDQKSSPRDSRWQCLFFTHNLRVPLTVVVQKQFIVQGVPKKLPF